jgi:NAD(P)-dependent dehydrogenase (short-subunit alcohol dehydrogenase family)
MAGRTVVITGATSGLGRVAAESLAANGARVVLIARDEMMTKAVRDQIRIATHSDTVEYSLAVLGELSQVREAAARVLEMTDRIDVLIHNAGALFDQRRTAPSGIELTTAVQVVAPFLLTGLLWDALRTGPPSRVLTMSSGGMYTAGLTVDRLMMPEIEYRGTEQYARAKRAQVTMNEIWAERTAGAGVNFHALHPGWADTPGVEAALPGFRRVMGPLLRSPEQGADTLLWLACDDGDPLDSNGRFWHDRRIRPIHKLATTRRTDTPDRRGRLWQWVSDAAEWALPGSAS